MLETQKTETIVKTKIRAKLINEVDDLLIYLLNKQVLSNDEKEKLHRESVVCSLIELSSMYNALEKLIQIL